MDKKIKTLKKSVIEGQISDGIELEEKKDIKKEEEWECEGTKKKKKK